MPYTHLNRALLKQWQNSGVDLKLVLVEWYDHCSFTTATWRSKEEYDSLNPPLCKTVGWVLKEDKQMMILVSTWQESEEFDDQFVGDMAILKGVIKSVKVLKE